MGLFDKGKSFVKKSPGYKLAGSVFGFGDGGRDLSGMIQAMDPGPRPDAAEWESMLDPKTGRLKSQYVLGGYAEEDSPYARLIQRYRDDAYRPAEEKSEYQQALENKLAEVQGQQLSDAAQQSATQLAQARSQLASRRGLSGAAAERLAASGSKDASRMMQAIRSQGAAQRLGIQADELARRQGLLQNLTGLEQDVEKTQLGIEGKNIDAALQEVGAGREKKQRDYEAQMASWAAAKQAQATLGAASGGKK